MPSNELITSKFSRHSTAEDVIAGIDLTNRSVIVTGASSGIGADIARRRQNLGSRGTSPGPRRCHNGGRLEAQGACLGIDHIRDPRRKHFQFSIFPGSGVS